MFLAKYSSVSPFIRIREPIPNQLFGKKAPEFNVSIRCEGIFNSSWYTLNGGELCTFEENGTIDQTEWNKLNNGSVIISFYANDSESNIGFRQINVFKDTLGPLIEITDPIPYAVFKEEAPSISLNIEEHNLHKTWYSLDNGTNNHTFNGLTVTLNQSLWDDIPDGIVKIDFYANDTLGNVGYKMFNVTKNVPDEVISSPGGGGGGGGGDGSSDADTIPFGNEFLIATAIGIIVIIIHKKRKIISKNI